ncbi:MAG: radical SAM/Cys-rich domain protein [Chitinophagaceae bacterium]|nr:MAG: radical SAM/Cys-rich domain protein [Chitinophagaceae bacterium]
MNPTKSLYSQHHFLSDVHHQMKVLEEVRGQHFPLFKDKLKEIGLYPFRPAGIEIFQVNLGKMCNQTCKHCHVDAGPDRKEIMTKETMQECLDALAKTNISTVDLTGGAPEMNPYFRWFVEEIKKLNRHVMVRCNLTIILANKKYHDLPEFYRKHQVEVISSLPFYNRGRTDRQRGAGVFDLSIKALRMLNEVGYGKENSNLKLNLVYNPAGAFLPPSQKTLEGEYKKELKERFDIDFNDLFVITNMPINRYLDYLLVSGNYEDYMTKLIHAFNPAAAKGVMCRNTISIGWDGYLYDCDFNQMLEMKVGCKNSQHISQFDEKALNNREIMLGQHCYGCTAGAGSSCGGQVT